MSDNAEPDVKPLKRASRRKRTLAQVEAHMRVVILYFVICLCVLVYLLGILAFWQTKSQYILFVLLLSALALFYRIQCSLFHYKGANPFMAPLSNFLRKILSRFL